MTKKAPRTSPTKRNSRKVRVEEVSRPLTVMYLTQRLQSMLTSTLISTSASVRRMAELTEQLIQSIENSDPRDAVDRPADISDATLGAIVGFWTHWPVQMSMCRAVVARSGIDNRDIPQVNYLLRCDYAFGHEEATRWLMKVAELLNLDSSRLWEESRICREMILAGDTKIGEGAANSATWPDYLGRRRAELPIVSQQAISEGEALFHKVVTLLELRISKLPPKLTIEQIVATRRQRPAFARDHLWLKWNEQLNSPTFDDAGAIRDKWNAMTHEERQPYGPQDNLIGKGKAGWDIVTKGIERATKERKAEAEI